MQVDPEAADAGHPVRRVGDARLPIFRIGVRGQHRADGPLDARAVEAILIERGDPAIDADRGGRARHEQQVAGVTLGQEDQPFAQASGVCRPALDVRWPLVDGIRHGFARRTRCRSPGLIQITNQLVEVVGSRHARRPILLARPV